MTHHFTLNAEILGTPAQAQHTLDAFREAVLPQQEWGITLHTLAPTGEMGIYSLEAEIEADTPEKATAAFDAFREAARPADYDVILWNLQPKDAPAEAPGPR